MIPPPIPVPTKTPAISSTRPPAPRMCSPTTPILTSLSTTTGTPTSALSSWLSGTSFQPRLGALRTTPRRSIVPGAPMLTALRSDSLSPAAWTAFSTKAAISEMSPLGFCDGFVGTFSSARILSLSSTTRARRLVPPMSTPTMMMSFVFCIDNPAAARKFSDSLSHSGSSGNHDWGCG